MNIEKLPKWAQTYIKDLERQRETAIREMNKVLDNQTESPFYVDEMICVESGSPSIKRRYIQAYKFNVEHAGVNLSVLLRDNSIDLQWSKNERLSGDIAFIPSSYQAARLVSKDNMGD